MIIAIEKKPFNKRAFISLVLFVSGLILPISGIINHRLQFEVLTPDRHFWMSVHNMAALLFSLSAITHISMNWRSLIHYAQRVNSVVISKEAISAVILILGMVSLFAMHAYHGN